MIIVQTPLRVSFFGGGTDFASYYLNEGGCVLSATIDKYIFVTIKKRFDKKLRVGWTKTELVNNIDQIKHNLIREAFRQTGIREQVEISTMADIPTDGSGLGSSSAVTVGALHAMHTLNGNLISEEQLAREACDIEIGTLNQPIGIQDQYIAAYGGLRFLEFSTDGCVTTQKVSLPEPLQKKLNENTMLFFTGMTRKSETILAEQKENIKDKLAVLGKMKQIAYTARDALIAGDVDAIGDFLHESWALKKQLASQISNAVLDEIMDVALSAGATGGKISGAGGGGFLLLYCPIARQEQVRAKLSKLQELSFKVESDGSKVIFNYQR